MHTREELERLRAIQLFIAGKSPKDICDSLRRPKKWLYKWVSRFRSGDPNWFTDEPRTPKHMPTKTPAEMVSRIVSARKALEESEYEDRGVFSIRQRLLDVGIDDLPSDATIARIVRHAGLVKKSQHRQSVGTPYPAPSAESPNDVHQIDLWGPRHLGIGKVCYAVNIIDVARRGPSINPVGSKDHETLISCLIRSWQTLGIPKVLQMDNMVLTTHPGCICRMLRLCLHVGVEPLLVPYREPWRQGVVEKFNDFYDKKFFRQHRFADLTDLKERTKIFEERCWQDKRLSALGGKTPAVAFPDSRLHLLPSGFAVDLSKLCIPAGKISCIRMVRSNHQVDLLGRKFQVSECYYREYVKATLFTEEGLIRLYHQDQQIAEFKFSMC